MTQRGEVIQRHVFIGLHVEVLGQLAEELGLLDAVDAQVGFQIGVELDHFGRIAGLLDHEVDHELFQLGRIQARRDSARFAARRQALSQRALSPRALVHSQPGPPEQAQLARQPESVRRSSSGAAARKFIT